MSYESKIKNQKMRIKWEQKCHSDANDVDEFEKLLKDETKEYSYVFALKENELNKATKFYNSKIKYNCAVSLMGSLVRFDDQSSFFRWWRTHVLAFKFQEIQGSLNWFKLMNVARIKASQRKTTDVAPSPSGPNTKHTVDFVFYNAINCQKPRASSPSSFQRKHALLAIV